MSSCTGWTLWREKKDLPEGLIFHVNYLGGDQQSFTLNFSKGASNVIAVTDKARGRVVPANRQ